MRLGGWWGGHNSWGDMGRVHVKERRSLGERDTLALGRQGSSDWDKWSASWDGDGMMDGYERDWRSGHAWDRARLGP